MSAVINAKSKIKELAQKAQETVADATLTQSEKKDALDKIEVDLKAMQDVVADHERVQSMLAGAEVDEKSAKVDASEKSAKSWSEQVIDSPVYAAVKSGASAHLRQSHAIEVKATITEGTPAGTAAGVGGATVLPGILPIKTQPLTIADLIPGGTLTGQLLTYVVETAWNNAAAKVAEGGLKPSSDLALAIKREVVGKIAHIAKVTEEMVQDVTAFQAYLEARMVLGVQRARENELLNGTGAPGLDGILNRVGLLTPIAVTGAAAAPAKVIDGVFKQITQVRVQSFTEPDAIVMNPLDWELIRLAKDGNGQYYAGGPFMGAYGNGQYTNVGTLWGLRVVVTTAVAQGTALVGSFAECSQYFARIGIVVEWTNSNEDDFNNNLLSVRAEERGALAVYRPNGFGTVTIAA